MDEPPEVHEGEVIEIYALADEHGRIQNHGFVNCKIVGPAMLSTRESVWSGNRTTTSLDHAILDLNPDQTIITGALVAHRCSFEGCLFHRIGFVTHVQEREDFKRSFLEERAEKEDW